MGVASGTRKIAIVTACTDANGSPDFVLNTVRATAEEIDNCIHYYLAEAKLLEDGYEPPFVHFDEDEAPDFLLPTIREYLGL
jgi:hypothetical protein